MADEQVPVDAVAEVAGIVLQPYQVIQRPLITEKNVHKSQRLNQYSFEVNPRATKEDVKLAVESLFNVKVTKVRTQTRRGKHRRYRYRMGKLNDWKKAIVSLAEDNRIDFY